MRKQAAQPYSFPIGVIGSTNGSGPFSRGSNPWWEAMLSMSQKEFYAEQAVDSYESNKHSRIIDRFQLDNQQYVLVEWDRAPGKIYVYFS